MYIKILFAVTAVLTFLFTVIAARFIIPILRSKKMGQKILDVGPRWHKSKEGTPTMGGIAFIIPVFVIGVGCSVYLGMNSDFQSIMPLSLTISFAALNALIGCIDDMAKFRKKQNEGLTAKQKFLLQLVAAALYLISMTFTGCISTSLYIPYVDISLELGVFYYVIAMLLLTGIVNSVNLTDGIDGLASSITLIVGIFFSAAAFLSGTFSEPDSAALSVLGALIIGATGGFLVYNFYPARVFMGDTGSLFLGALVVGGAFMMKNPLIVIVVGFIYIMETLSVMIQVTYFKLTHGKRLFKMSPIHHHFEKCGWSEVKVVSVFTFVTIISCAVAWFGL